MAQAQAVADANIGLAQNLHERMAELDQMAADALSAPVQTEMTSWEAERTGTKLAPPSPSRGGPELVLCQQCWDVPCACGALARAAGKADAERTISGGGHRGSGGHGRSGAGAPLPSGGRTAPQERPQWGRGQAQPPVDYSQGAPKVKGAISSPKGYVFDATPSRRGGAFPYNVGKSQSCMV